MTRYTHLILDVDSTLSGIEGIDWLARRRGAAVGREIAALTVAAMRGDVPLESIYASRLTCVRPTRDDVAALADAYVEAAAVGAREAIATIVGAGLRVLIVSGGLREAMLPLARRVGIAPGDVHAVSVYFDETGAYRGYDVASPLWRTGGKAVLARSLVPAASAVAVGDGLTDAELKPVVAMFIAFTGVVRREPVVAAADAVVSRFADLPQYILV